MLLISLCLFKLYDLAAVALKEHVGHDVDAPVRVRGAGDDVPPRPGHEEDVARAEDHAEGLGGGGEGVGLPEAPGVVGVQVHGAEPVGERCDVGVGALVEARHPFSKPWQEHIQTALLDMSRFFTQL